MENFRGVSLSFAFHSINLFPIFPTVLFLKKNQREMGIADENVKSKTPIGTVLVAEIHNEL
jgi:hypothetical protein